MFNLSSETVLTSTSTYEANWNTWFREATGQPPTDDAMYDSKLYPFLSTTLEMREMGIVQQSA